MYLSIDPATSSGYAIFNVEKQLIHYGFFKPRTSNLENELSDIHDFFKRLIHEHKITNVFIEDFKVGSRQQKSAAEKSYSIRAILRYLAYKQNCKIKVVNISEWRKYIVGKANISKEDKKKHGKDANKIMVINALKNKYNIILPDKTENPLTGNHNKTPYDITDAIAIGLFSLKV